MAQSLLYKSSNCCAIKNNWGIAVKQGNYKYFFGKMQHSLFIVVKKKRRQNKNKLIDCFVNLQDNLKVWSHLRVDTKFEDRNSVQTTYI